MNPVILSKSYAEPPFCEKEILRYAGCRSADEQTTELLSSCISEVKGKLFYKVCFCELPVSVKEDICDLGAFKISSKKLAVNLRDCSSVILFAATVGIELDRLIAKYGRLSPSRALMLQAIGAERIEALCDAFCEDIAHEQGVGLKPRFSPGYGDLSLETQKEIFRLLDPAKRIGLSLNDSLLMCPSKSVTAFVGLTDKIQNQPTQKCRACDKKDCAFRGVI